MPLKGNCNNCSKQTSCVDFLRIIAILKDAPAAKITIKECPNWEKLKDLPHYRAYWAMWLKTGRWKGEEA